MIPNGFRTLAIVACLMLGVTANLHADPLKPPFDVAARRALLGAPVADFACKAAPAPVRDLIFAGFYAKGSGSSRVDAAAMTRYHGARKPVDIFSGGLSRMADRYAQSRPAHAAVARCALGWMQRWAAAGAMLGEVSQQGGYVRKWELGTVSAAYLKIRHASGLDAAKTAAVEKWIGAWAAVVRDDYSTGTHRNSRNNNHLYWAAYAVGLAAVVGNDRALFDWSLERTRFAIGQIADDGTLELELARRSKALHYHVYSAMPLVLTAELAAQNGIDLYGAEDGALHRLVRRVLGGLDDPAYFEKLTGEKQGWVGKLVGGRLAWMELYFARFRTPAVRPWIERFRPMGDRRAGGDLSFLYGLHPLPPGE